MRGKLIPGSVSISRMLYAEGFCSRSFHKWSRISFSKPKFFPEVNNSNLRFQICTSRGFGLAYSTQSEAAPAKENIFLELGNLMKKGLLKRKDVDKALSNNASYRDHCNSLLVLQCISKLPDISPNNRVALAENFLAKVKSIGGVVTEDHCLQVLECYLQSKYFENLDSFWSAMKEYKVNQSNEIKLMIFKCLSVEGTKKKDFANDLAKELENSNLENTEELYATKIYNLAVSGHTEEALKTIKQMKEEKIKIGSSIYTSLLKALVLKEDIHFTQYLTGDVLMDEMTFSDDQIIEILENVALSEHYKALSDVKLLCDDEVFMRSSQIVLLKLIYRNKVESAYAFMNQLFSLSYNCESKEKDVLFNEICKSFIEESLKINYSVNDLAKKCLEMRKLNECLYSMEYALYCCLQEADMKRSLAILQIMFNKNIPLEPHYFWPLFLIFKEKFGDEGILFILDKMAALNVPFNPETLMDYVFPHMSNLKFASHIFTRVNMIEAQRELFAEVFLLYKIKNRHFKESIDFMREYFAKEERTYTFLEHPLMEALLDNPNCEEAVIIMKQTKAVDPFLVISKLWSRNDVKEIRQLSNYFEKHKIYTKRVEEAESFIVLNKNQPFIREVVSGLINECPAEEQITPGTLKTKKSSRFDELTYLEEAEVHLEELKAKNVNTVGQRLRLMAMYIKSQMYDKAIQTKKEVLEIMGENAEFTPGYLIRFAKLAALENDMDNAIRYLNVLKEKYSHFKMGSLTGLSLCQQFIQNGHYVEVVKLLRVLPEWEGKPQTLLMVPVQVLKAVAELGMLELTDLIFKIMLQKKFIKINTNTLRVYTKTCLSANDLEKAVNEYERIAMEYDIVSNTTSVLRSVVEAGRLDLAEKVTLLFSKKTKNAWASLLAVIACAGDVDVLMSYSEKMNFPLDDENMIKKCLRGQFPRLPSTTFKTMVLAALTNGLPYDHLVEGGIRTSINERDWEKTKDLLNFFKSNNIALNEDQLSRLTTHLELGAIEAASKNIDI